MNDKKLIIAGLVVFCAIIFLPFMLNIGKASLAPEPELSPEALAAQKTGKTCVLPKIEMKAGHMQILDIWRDTVVRKGERIYINSNGQSFTMSLSSGENSCIGCHTNKSEFCDSCHTYASVKPYCWDCHNEPMESKR